MASIFRNMSRKSKLNFLSVGVSAYSLKSKFKVIQQIKAKTRLSLTLIDFSRSLQVGSSCRLAWNLSWTSWSTPAQQLLLACTETFWPQTDTNLCKRKINKSLNHEGDPFINEIIPLWREGMVWASDECFYLEHKYEHVEREEGLHKQHFRTGLDELRRQVFNTWRSNNIFLSFIT